MELFGSFDAIIDFANDIGMAPRSNSVVSDVVSKEYLNRLDPYPSLPDGFKYASINSPVSQDDFANFTAMGGKSQGRCHVEF
jgi:hypothetical protein